jgi:hypothetical protein
MKNAFTQKPHTAPVESAKSKKTKQDALSTIAHAFITRQNPSKQQQEQSPTSIRRTPPQQRSMR